MVPPQNTTAEEGSRVRFECQAGGYPDNVTVHWSLNNVDVNDVVQLTQPLRRVDVLPDGALVIDDVHKDDTGWYKCRPSNRLGTAPEADAFLNVTCESLLTLILYLLYSAPIKSNQNAMSLALINFIHPQLVEHVKEEKLNCIYKVDTNVDSNFNVRRLKYHSVVQS